MFRTIIWYCNFAISLVCYIPVMLYAGYIKKTKTPREFENFVFNATSKWAMNKVKLSGADVYVEGIENIPEDGAVLFIGNHQGNFDIALFMSFIKKHKGFVAKVEMDKVPLLRTWMRYIGCLFMDRSSIRKSAETIATGSRMLKNGHSLVIFPEGTRSRCDKMGDFKAGSFKLATKSKVPIIPVTIDGSYKLMEANGGKIVPAKVSMYIHKPIETQGLSSEEVDTLPTRVCEIIESKLPKLK